MRLIPALLLLPTLLFSQVKDHATITPAKPVIGNEITVVYTPDPAAVVTGGVGCQTLLCTADGPLKLVETPLTQEGTAWRGKFKLDNPAATYLLVRFVVGDTPGAEVRDVVVCNKNGKAVKGAMAARGSFLANGNWAGFKRTPDLAAAKEALLKEKKLYGGLIAEPKLWEIALRQNPNNRGQIRQELDAYAKANAANDEAHFAMAQWYEKIGDTASAKRVREIVAMRWPVGKAAYAFRIQDLNRVKDPAARLGLALPIMNDFHELTSDQVDYLQRIAFNGYLKVKDYDNAAAALASGKSVPGEAYNALAWPLIEKGQSLEKATAWAKKGIDILRDDDAAKKPPTISMKEWREGKQGDLAAILDTYGYGLMQLGRSAEAELAYAESYKIMKGEDADVDAHYAEALVRNKHFREAVDLGIECVKAGQGSPKLKDLMKSAWAEGAAFDSLPEAKRSEYAALLDGASKQNAERLRKKLLATRVSKPAPDFTLDDLDGKPVTLSSLKGKVVVVDFWATWCGPCKSSFPFYQRVYDKYRDNPKVAFLTVDTWEREKDMAATVANAKRFLMLNLYTFPVVVDKLEEPRAVGQYEVEGIPTKFIIDPKGNINFISVGFDGPGMEDELTQQIEILLNESMGSLR